MDESGYLQNTQAVLLQQHPCIKGCSSAFQTTRSKNISWRLFSRYFHFCPQWRWASGLGNDASAIIYHQSILVGVYLATGRPLFPSG